METDGLPTHEEVLGRYSPLGSDLAEHWGHRDTGWKVRGREVLNELGETIGVMDSPDLAATVVRAVNSVAR